MATARTTTTRDIRRVYSLAPVDLAGCPHTNDDSAYAEELFDQWLAAHDAEVAGEAWEQGLNTGIGYKTAMDTLGGSAPEPPNPYATEEVD